MLEPKKPAVKPSDARSISDPPDMGKLRPADAVAGAMVLAPEQNSVGGWRFELAVPRRGGRKVELVVDGYGRRGAAEDDAEALKSALTDLIRQWRAEGAVEALEEAAARLAGQVNDYEKCAADCWSDEGASSRYAGKAEAYGEAASLLRARIRPISDPPDMG